MPLSRPFRNSCRHGCARGWQSAILLAVAAGILACGKGSPTAPAQTPGVAKTGLPVVALARAPELLAELPSPSGVRVCQGYAFVDTMGGARLVVVGRLCSGALSLGHTEGAATSPLGKAGDWRWTQLPGVAPPDTCYEPQGVDDIATMPSEGGFLGRGLYTLKRSPKCVTAWPDPLILMAGAGGSGETTTDVIMPVSGQPFGLTAPRRISQAPGGIAVLDFQTTARVRIARTAPYGLPARLDELDLAPPPDTAAHAPWGLALRADSGIALAAEAGLYFAAPGATAAQLVYPWPTGAVHPEGGLDRGCCDVGWIMDPISGGAFLVNRGDHVLVIDDHTFATLNKWTPSWPPIASVTPIVRVRALQAQPEIGAMVLVEDAGEFGERVAIYGWALAGATLGASLPQGWQSPESPAPTP